MLSLIEFQMRTLGLRFEIDGIYYVMRERRVGLNSIVIPRQPSLSAFGPYSAFSRDWKSVNQVIFRPT